MDMLCRRGVGYTYRYGKSKILLGEVQKVAGSSTKTLVVVKVSEGGIPEKERRFWLSAVQIVDPVRKAEMTALHAFLRGRHWS